MSEPAECSSDWHDSCFDIVSGMCSIAKKGSGNGFTETAVSICKRSNVKRLEDAIYVGNRVQATLCREEILLRKTKEYNRQKGSKCVESDDF